MLFLPSRCEEGLSATGTKWIQGGKKPFYRGLSKNKTLNLVK